MQNTRREFNAWRSMVRSAYHPSDRDYKHVGAKGVGVCAAWRESFYVFYEDMGDTPPGAAIKRRDETKDFGPENCYWGAVHG